MSEVLATYEYELIYNIEYSIKCTNKDICTKAIIPSEYNGLPVTIIGENAFHSCLSLTSIEIPPSVVSIGYYAFAYCSSLTSATIGNSVTYIGECAFNNCSSLTSIEIPDNVTSIGNSAFSGCDKLKNIEIPDSVIFIGDSVFANCYSLKYICCNIESQPSGWGSNWKEACDASVFWGASIDAQGLLYTFINNNTEYEVSSANAQEDGSSSVNFFDYTELVIPSTYKGLPVTSIGEYAFEKCYALKNVTFGFNTTFIGKYAFRHCISLETISIPDSVTSIGSSAFYGCNALTSIEIPNSVTSMGSLTFYGCDKLKSVSISNNITSIGVGTFKECTSLESIIIPNNVTSIGNYAFQYCNSLKTVLLLSKEPPSMGLSPFDFGEEIKLYCPTALGEIYKTAQGWSEYADKIVANDLKINFLLNANAEKKYFASKNELKNELSALKELVLDMTHPIGSVYFSMEATNPSVLFGGVWEELDSERTLWLTSTSRSVMNGDKPQTIAAALPNIKGETVPLSGAEGLQEGLKELLQLFNVDLDTFPDKNAISSVSYDTVNLEDNALGMIIGGIAGGLGGFLAQLLTSIEKVEVVRSYFDAGNYNSIYKDDCDTVQPPAIRMYGWRRIA